MKKVKKSIAILIALIVVITNITIVSAQTNNSTKSSVIEEQEKDQVIQVNEDNNIQESNGNIVRGKVLVKYKEQYKSAYRSFSAESVQTDNLEIKTLNIDQNADILQTVENLNNSPDVEYAEPVFVYKALGAEETQLQTVNKEVYSNDEYFLNNWQWGLDAINVYNMWNDVIQEEREDITIAVLDTGVDLQHEDLAGSIVSGYDFINEDNIADDDYGHGTHVAGIAAAINNNGKGIAGVAGGSKIMPVKVLDNTGSGDTVSIINGINYAVEHGADIINLSLGSNYRSMALEDTIKNAIEKGVVIVAAAGNESYFKEEYRRLIIDDSYLYYLEPVIYPAAYEGVIGVGAVDYNNNIISKASFSNGGSEVDVVAPGVDILSTYPKDLDSEIGINGYEVLRGTSMATPFVAGIAALVKADNPTLTAQEIQQLIKDNATDLGSVEGRDKYYGYGLVNGNSTSKSNPPFPLNRFELNFRRDNDTDNYGYKPTSVNYKSNMDDQSSVAQDVYGQYNLMRTEYSFSEDGRRTQISESEIETVIDIVYGEGDFIHFDIPSNKNYGYYISNKDGYLSSNVVFPNSKTITGSISLPNGETAPEGGIDIRISKESYYDSMVPSRVRPVGTVVTIPRGESSVSYTLSNIEYDSLIVKYEVLTETNKYINCGYYNSSGTTGLYDEAEEIELTSKLTKDIDMTVLPLNFYIDNEGNDFDNAVNLEGNSIIASLDYAGDNDTFKIEIDKDDYYSIKTIGDVNTLYSLYDNNNNFIADKKIINTYIYDISCYLEKGTYFLKVEGNSEYELGQYELQIKEIPLLSEDAGSSFYSVYNLAIGDKLGNFASSSDIDYLKIEIEEAGYYLIDSNIYNHFYNEDKTGGDGYPGTYLKYLEPGIYYIKTHEFLSGTEVYHIKVSKYDFSDDYGDDFENAELVDTDTIVSGELENRYNRDYDCFKLKITAENNSEGQLYQVNLTSNDDEYNIDLDLYDEDEEYIASGYYYSEISDQPMLEYLQPGTYYIKIDGYGSTDVIPYEFTVEKQDIEFADENLEAAVREALIKPEGEFSYSELEDITRLDANERGIESVEGIQYLPNLEELNLENNNITDISILSQLGNLYYLNLDNNNISSIFDNINDISEISGFGNLSELSLAHNNISDISLLGYLNGLSYLRLNNNMITDINALSPLENLEYLYLAGNQISDYTPVQECYNELLGKDFEIPSSDDDNDSSGGSSGGNTGGSGGGTDNTLIDKDNDEEDDDNESNDTIKGEVNPQKAQEIIDNESKEELTLNMKNGNKYKNVELAMKSDILRIASAKGKPVIIETDKVTIQMQPDTIDLKVKEEVILGIKERELKDIKDEIGNIDRDENIIAGVFDFDLTVDGNKIHNFNKPVKITLEVDMSKIKDKDKVGIYYFNEANHSWEYVGGKLTDEGKLIVQLEHFSIYAVMEYNKTFADTINHWAKEDIEKMASRHIVKGVSTDSFEPDSNITKAEFTVLLVRALNVNGSSENKFKDVKLDSWYFDDISKAYNAGIISGDNERQFSPDSNITREQMAAMIMNAFQYASGVNIDKIIITQEIRFHDQDKASNWAVRSIILANTKGFMTGYPNKMFKPKDNATRAQAVVVIKNLLAELGEVSK